MASHYWRPVQWILHCWSKGPRHYNKSLEDNSPLPRLAQLGIVFLQMSQMALHQLRASQIGHTNSPPRSGLGPPSHSAKPPTLMDRLTPINGLSANSGRAELLAQHCASHNSPCQEVIPVFFGAAATARAPAQWRIGLKAIAGSDVIRMGLAATGITEHVLR